MRVSSLETCIPLCALEELDYDPVFLRRFSVSELMDDRITLLHESETIDWNGSWHKENRSRL